MIEQVRVTFYTATAGFFPYGAKQPAFGGLSDSFAQLADWGHGAALSLTKLIDPAEDADDLPVYLFGIQQIGNDWLLGCWNEVPTTDNSVASVAMNSVVGEPQIHQNDMAPNTIAGYATYFWCVPERGVVASLKFAGGAAGRFPMETYMRNFLAFESRYVRTKVNESGEEVIVGHAPDGQQEPHTARPRFKLATYRKKGKRAYLLQNHARIRKVIRKGQVTLENVIERGMFQNFVRFVRGDAEQPNVVTGTRSGLLPVSMTPC